MKRSRKGEKTLLIKEAPPPADPTDAPVWEGRSADRKEQENEADAKN